MPAAMMAEPMPAKTSQKVPKDSAIQRFEREGGMSESIAFKEEMATLAGPGVAWECEKCTRKE
jgi:hypothetical protein